MFLEVPQTFLTIARHESPQPAPEVGSVMRFAVGYRIGHGTAIPLFRPDDQYRQRAPRAPTRPEPAPAALLASRRGRCLDGHGRGKLIERGVPELAAGRVLVAVRASMISPGTELSRAKRFRATPDPEVAARPFGYSNAGTVAAAGAGVTRFRAGDRVACMGGGMAFHAD